MPSRDTDVLTVRTPLALADAIRAEAEKRGLSVSALINKHLDAAFGHACEDRKQTRKPVLKQEVDTPERDD